MQSPCSFVFSGFQNLADVGLCLYLFLYLFPYSPDLCCTCRIQVMSYCPWSKEFSLHSPSPLCLSHWTCPLCGGYLCTCLSPPVHWELFRKNGLMECMDRFGCLGILTIIIKEENWHLLLCPGHWLYVLCVLSHLIFIKSWIVYVVGYGKKSSFLEYFVLFFCFCTDSS